MSGYVGVRSVAKKIDKLYVGDGAGIARAVQKAYVGDPRGVAELWYQRATPMGSLAVGSVVYFAVGGVRTPWIVVEQGCPSPMYDASCDGTWLLYKDVYSSKQWSKTVKNDYSLSNIRAYMDSTFLNAIDKNVRSVIKDVRIPYRPGSGSSTSVNSGASGLFCKIFLLSAAEVNIGFNNRPKEGVWLKYFMNCNTTGADDIRVANYNGVPGDWWLRTPDTAKSSNAVLVTNTGAMSSANVAYLHGFRPALVLPQDALVDENGNVIGG